MFGLSPYQGLVVFEKAGRVSFSYRPRHGSFRGVFTVESPDGQLFRKNALLTPVFDLAGKKIELPDETTVRAGTGSGETLVTFQRGRETLVAAIGKNGAWKTKALLHGFTQPTVVLRLPGKATSSTKNHIVFTNDGRFALAAHRSNATFTRITPLGEGLRARARSFDHGALSVLRASLERQGILLLYTSRSNDGNLTLGGALFDKKRPDRLLWRSELPLWESAPEYGQEVSILGGGNIGKYFSLYVQSGETIEAIPLPRYWDAPLSLEKSKQRKKPPKTKTVRVLSLERGHDNPLIEPNPENAWEAYATFNPAAVSLNGRVHLLYRAQGYDGLSVLGYASSLDGIHLLEREREPVFVPTRAFETRTTEADQHPYPYASGGGYGGCEDPRLTEIEGTLYLIYVAFDGTHPPGVALSSIAVSDFLEKRWRWTPPKLISRPGQIQKNWVIFPEKINGRFALLHGISPTIRIEYVDDLKSLGDGKYIESLRPHGGYGYVQPERRHDWDNIVRGAGAPPLKTDHGWLIFYHAMDYRDPGKYKVGAMLLDLEHPETVLCRSRQPVLEPEMSYENDGHKRGVIYVCGAVIKDGFLFVYYGASDRASAVAVAPLSTFLTELLAHRTPTLKKLALSRSSTL
jgi:beta-1,2-mannobiose phosphorylase / 1,2-beta-oligomannan phosphorylase